MAYGILWVLIIPATVILALMMNLIITIIGCRRDQKRAVGFFHPYTNDGGGGERVLWCAVKAIQEEYPDLDCVIYTGDHRDASPGSLYGRALNRFGVKLPCPLKVLHLYKRKWVDEATYPRFTMIGQSLGSMYLAWEAMCSLTPVYFLDTSGYAFTYPIARMFGCKVICYTHYPTISLDMLSRVHGRTSMYNNDALIAKSKLLSRGKGLYYRVFSWLYGIVGSHANLAMVNSSWTKSHIEKLWGNSDCIKLVYPPCDTSALQAITDMLSIDHPLSASSALWHILMHRCLPLNFRRKDILHHNVLCKQDFNELPLERSKTPPKIISVAQFRPEKAHLIQLEAFADAVEKLDENHPRPKLQFVGSCRNEADKKRLRKLKEQAVILNVAEDVEFHQNVMYSNLVELLGGAIAGLHSMIDEHFGICVVEFMAAGAIPIAHNSAGPKLDIVVEEDGEQTGFLAQNVQEYADAIIKVIQMPESERLSMAAAARRRAARFSEDRFYEYFKAAVRPIISPSLK